MENSPAALPVRPELNVQMPSVDVEKQPEQPPEPDANYLQADMTDLSRTETREAANRLNDDLELLRAERIVSVQEHRSRDSRSMRRAPVDDAFNSASSPTAAISTAKKETFLTEFWRSLKKFPRVLRYVVYAIPIALVLLVPIFLGIFAYGRDENPVGGSGGVQLLWFGIWLEVVWLTLWAARLVASIMPFTFGIIAKAVGSSNDKKWCDIGRELELPTSLFLWLLSILVVAPDPGDANTDVVWVGVMFKIIIALFTLAALNFVEKILIQWIAASFHLRTYSHRIRDNTMRIDCLNEAKDIAWDPSAPAGYSTAGQSSGTRTPLKTIQNNARHALGKVGNAATRMAGDFTGRRILKGNHPRKVVVELLRNTDSSYSLARVFYRTFVKPGRSTITLEDFQPAFPTTEDAEACFGVFDKDLNGDVSMEELEMVCNEIHLEKKAIAASLKDLDSVIKKLDQVFVFIIVVISVIVFVSIISNSAAAALTSMGTVVLGLSWLLQATAQEFLQSIIFVFVKHPFDVGDRVTIYGNTGSMMRGDDYYVMEVSLLYTEFKKMEGHVVQAPNSLLNTLFILNQRRSQELADPVSLTLRFGTTEAQIEELKSRMRNFCLQNKRDYAPRIISEVKTIDEVYSITMNIIFFHKGNFQNELLRLTRHNRFAVELMHQMHEMGLEGPRVVQPGGMRAMPLYWSQVQPPAGQNAPVSSPPPQPATQPSTRRRGNSRSAVVDAGVDFQDVYRSRRTEGHATHLSSISQSPDEDSGTSAGTDDPTSASASGRAAGPASGIVAVLRIQYYR
ncbi:Mechanosensitive ion channel protein 9 [Echria macrotheca]|uniref:Mechanosensitive ion channel protein n=1 Tax=Echria macrotheca TaxID=438768 RepID=A0AAJ0BS57_9PEZI|nr:Mechanosensitive ion channel protein 9 [Echria macrotheca]